MKKSLGIFYSKLYTCFVCFRKGLNDNKIFFEVFVAGCLSAMAIIVSIQSNKIAQSQTKMMEEQGLPQIEIRYNQEKNQRTEIYDYNKWYVFNQGEKLSNLETETMSFVYYNSKEGLFDTVLFPVYGYLGMRGMLTGEGDNLVYEFDNDYSGAKEVELRNALLNKGYFEVRNYIMLKYKDIYNGAHDEYYCIWPGIREISKTEWDTLKQKHINVNEHYFKRLTYYDVLKYFESYRTNSN